MMLGWLPMWFSLPSVARRKKDTWRGGGVLCDLGNGVGTHYKVLETPEALRIELFGVLDEKSADALDAELAGLLARPQLGSTGVIFVTMGLSECVEAARLVLVRIQKRLARVP